MIWCVLFNEAGWFYKFGCDTIYRVSLQVNEQVMFSSFFLLFLNSDISGGADFFKMSVWQPLAKMKPRQRLP